MRNERQLNGARNIRNSIRQSSTDSVTYNMMRNESVEVIRDCEFNLYLSKLGLFLRPRYVNCKEPNYVIKMGGGLFPFVKAQIF